MAKARRTQSIDRSKGTKTAAARPVYNPLPLSAWFKLVGVSAREVAEELKIEESHLSNISSGKRPYLRPHLEGIADFLSRKAKFHIFPSMLLHPPGDEPLALLVSRLPPDEQRRFARMLKVWAEGEERPQS